MHAGYQQSHYFDENHPTDEAQEQRSFGYTTSGFYFYDESEAYVVGPFATFDGAEKVRVAYEP